MTKNMSIKIYYLRQIKSLNIFLPKPHTATSSSLNKSSEYLMSFATHK